MKTLWFSLYFSMNIWGLLLSISQLPFPRLLQLVSSYLMTNSRGTAKQGVLSSPAGSVHKREAETTAVTCTNALQKGGGSEGLLYVLKVFILPVTNSGSLENVVKQGFDSSCTSWPSWLFNPVIIIILKHIGIVPKFTRDFSQSACPCAFQPHFWLLC